jgi:rhamnose transport system substrate-binding protein
MTFKLGKSGRAIAAAATLAAVAAVAVSVAPASAAIQHAASGITVYYIPKDTNNPYEVIADQGGKTALTALGDTQVVSSGTEDTAAAQEPSIQTAIQSGAKAIVIAGNDPDGLCPQLKAAMAAGVAVVTFDSDTSCRQLFINQANTNQNAWIGFMKKELKLPKYKNMKLVKIYYGNDNPQQSLTATQSMLQAYPNLTGIISPTTVGISTAAQYLSHSKYKGKVHLTGLGLPSQMKKYVLDGTVKEFELWNPNDLGYLAGYAADALASKKITGKVGETFTAGKLGKYTIINAAGGPQVVLGKPYVFNKANVAKFNF